MSKTSKTQDDATKYILRHDLERQMSRLMNALLKEHPEDPKQFLVEYLSTKMTKRQIEEAGLCYIKEKEEEVIEKEQEQDENHGVVVDNMSPTAAAAAATREDGTQTEMNEEKANYEENGKLGNENELHTDPATDDMGAPKTADISASAHDITKEEERESGIDEGGAPKEERADAKEEETAGAAASNEDARAGGETAADTDAGVAMEGAGETGHADTDAAAAAIADGAAAESDAQAQDAESLDPPVRGTADAVAAADACDGENEDANGAIIEASATTATATDGVSASVPVEAAPAEVPRSAENEEAPPPHEEEAGTKAADAGEAAPVSASEDDKARDTPPEAAAAPGVDDASLTGGALIEGRPLQEDVVGEQAAVQDTAEEKGEAL